MQVQRCLRALLQLPDWWPGQLLLYQRASCLLPGWPATPQWPAQPVVARRPRLRGSRSVIRSVILLCASSVSLNETFLCGTIYVHAHIALVTVPTTVSLSSRTCGAATALFTDLLACCGGVGFVTDGVAAVSRRALAADVRWPPG